MRKLKLKEVIYVFWKEGEAIVWRSGWNKSVKMELNDFVINIFIYNCFPLKSKITKREGSCHPFSLQYLQKKSSYLTLSTRNSFRNIKKNVFSFYYTI